MIGNAKHIPMKNTLFLRTGKISAAVLLLLTTACNQDAKIAESTVRKAVDPVLQNNLAFRNFTVNSDKADTISISEGTQLFIPPGTFVDENGKAVTGDVQIHYRAFYTPGEIIASGISMFYDTANAEHVFSSAGMFEITGTQNGNPVSIAKGKSIDMNFASTRNDAQYSFYEMDTTNAKWKFVTTGNAEPNSFRNKLIAELDKLIPKPVEPKLFDANKPVIDIDVDTKDHPELAGYDGILWQYAGTGTDPEKNKWVYDENWTSTQLTMRDSSTCMYGLKLSSGTKTFSTNVYPTLKGQNYQKAVSEFRNKMEVFNATETVRQQKRKDVALTTEYQRRTKIITFGICNWDRYQIYGSPEYAQVEFHFDDPEFERQRENVAIYFVAISGQMVSSCNGASTSSFVFTSSSNSAVIGILRGTTKVAVLNNSEFLVAVSGDRTKHSKLQLHPTSMTVKDNRDLDILIAKL
ncbi:hypothetical protein BH09BAC5_BH09BAC5_28580 [soil metagenome]